YRLAKEPAPTGDPTPEQTRRDKLERLRTVLWEYAQAHQGKFPSDSSNAEIPKECWEVPDPTGMRYVYVKNTDPSRGAMPLAYEPEIYGPERLVLFTNGVIRLIKSEEFTSALSPEG